MEERTGYAAAWPEWQAALADNLAQAVEGVVLRQRRKIDELTKLEEEDAKHVSDPPPCKQAVAPAPELAEGVCRAKL